DETTHADDHSVPHVGRRRTSDHQDPHTLLIDELEIPLFVRPCHNVEPSSDQSQCTNLEALAEVADGGSMHGF
ncbi:MAG: hypothetical protein AAGB03_03765, partial [Pseudomonadota bacterium]